MSDTRMWAKKIAAGLFGLYLLAASGASFYQSRHLKEPVVAGPGVTKVLRLGDYFAGVDGTANDVNIYVLEGKEPGASMMVLGGTHPEEPAPQLAAWLIVEHAIVEQGRLFVVLSANRSGTTVTKPGGAYPPHYTIRTPWGGQVFRMGDRYTNPLDQWPDPEVYIHYPSGDYLAYADVRNLNRAWPGRPNGTLTEQTTYAYMQLIARERIDVVIDLHEAELQYPIISTVVAHQRGTDLATMVSMMLTDSEFRIGSEFSPPALHGLSHREIGDHSPAFGLLFETPEPFLDATRGVTSAGVLLSGKDEFVVRAGKAGLLYERIDEKGWPIDVRVGRHTSSVAQVLQTWSDDHAERPIVARSIPRYQDVVTHGTGFYLKDPATATTGRLYYE